MLGPGYLARTRTGTVQSVLVDGVEALEGYIGSYLPQIFVALLVPLFLLFYLFLLDRAIGICILAGLVLATCGPRLWDRLLGKYGASHWKAYANLNAQFLDSMQGMTMLKAFNASTRHGAKLHQDAVALSRATMAQLSLSLLGSGIVSLARNGATTLAISIGAFHLLTGQLSFSSMLILLFIVNECFRPLADLNTYWHQGYQGVSAAAGIFAFLDTSPEVRETTTPLQLPDKRQALSVRVNHLTFRYAPDLPPALQHVSLQLEPDTITALVGPSGSGKSTLVSLFLRFFDPEEGQILLNEHDIRQYLLDDVRNLISVVSQDTYLFYGTVAENLRMARPGATLQELEDVARMAQAHDFVMQLPHGYETLVGERGFTLSGGQRQRLAIARALLKNAPFLILDEATSSLDVENEAALQEALNHVMLHRTTLIIAHRLSTVRYAKTIHVLENGMLTETGTHEELIARSGTYRRLVAAQTTQEELL